MSKVDLKLQEKQKIIDPIFIQNKSKNKKIYMKVELIKSLPILKRPHRKILK